MRSPEMIIKRPLLTEKGTFLKETGGMSEEDMVDPESVSPQMLLEVLATRTRSKSSTRWRSSGTSTC